MPDSKQFSSYKSLATSGLPLKKIKTTGTFFFLEGKEEDGKGRGDETKINLQSSGMSQSLYRLFHAPIPKCMASQTAPAVYQPVKGTAAWPLPPQVTELQFEVAAIGLSSSRSMLELVGWRLL